MQTYMSILCCPPEQAASASGLPGQSEAGAGSRSDLQVQSSRHQLLWPGRLQRSQRVQNLPTWFPWSALCCQNYQGDIWGIFRRRKRGLGNVGEISSDWKAVKKELLHSSYSPSLLRPTIQSTSHGRLPPLHQAASWSIPCTWRWGRVAPPAQSVLVRWPSSGSTAAPRCPAQSAPPTWTTPTSTVPPPTGQLWSSA